MTTEGLPDGAQRDVERFRQADAVFDAALDVEPDERSAFVESACAGDAELRADVLRLLRAHDRAGTFLSTPAAGLAQSLLEDAGPFSLGQVGPYRIVRRLGRGGMGTVWLARDERLDRDVALKFLRDVTDGGAPVADAEARFAVEARAAARLNHPHVASVYDVGAAPDGRLYIAMAYCAGGSLAERLARGALPVGEAVSVARQLAGALAGAHACGVVHRDVKPGNVLFDTGGNVRLADFGIAKFFGDPSTHPGAVVGTVAYLAPEQVRGEPADHRADVWALGVTLYEMLAGRRPFAGESHAAVMHAVLGAEPEPLVCVRPDVPAALDALVARLLAKAPAARPCAAEDVERALAVLQADLSGGSGHTGALGLQGSAAQPVPRRARRFLAAMVIVVAGLGGYLAWQGTGRAARQPTAVPIMRAAPAAPPLASVAVLPFANTSGDPADEPFSDGLTDELIGAISQVPGLKVSPRTSAFALKGKGLGARAVGDTLGVATVVEGSVSRVGDRLKVGVQLVSAADDRVLWSERYDRELRDVFSVQEEIARAVVAALRLRLGTSDSAPLVHRATRDLVAYELFLKGRYFWTRRTEGSLRQALSYFGQAVARDSTYARAYTGLADTYTLLGIFGHQPTRQVMPRAKAAVGRALALDSTLAEAHAAHAHVLWVYDRNWADAGREFERALALDRSAATARLLYGIYLMDQRRFAESEAALVEARPLDPLDPSISLSLGRLWLGARRGDHGVAMMRAALELNPAFSYAHQQLGHAYLTLGRTTEALIALRRAAALSGARDSAHLAYGLAVAGQRAEATRVLEELLRSSTRRYLPPVGMAVAYVGLGDRDAAFRWLERAAEERAPFVTALQTLPAFDPLHADRRWPQLLRRVGLLR